MLLGDYCLFLRYVPSRRLVASAGVRPASHTVAQDRPPAPLTNLSMRTSHIEMGAWTFGSIYNLMLT